MTGSGQGYAVLGWLAWKVLRRRLLRRGKGAVGFATKLVAITAGMAALAGAAWWFLRTDDADEGDGK